jgi:carboxypeptidase C (cathepsin A)
LYAWYSNAVANHPRWQYQPTFKSLDVKPLEMNGREIGLKKDFKNLDFVEIYDAGLFSPGDKPAEVSFTIHSWFDDGIKST